MRPSEEYTNGNGVRAGGGAPSSEGSGSGSRSRSGSGSSGSGGDSEAELSLCDAGAPARALAALNALRKSRQHYDCVLLAAAAPPAPAEEVPAHRAVLAAASPHLLDALAAAPPAHSPPAASPAAADAPAYRVEGVDAASLRALVEYLYTGRLRVREEAAARRLYLAAWRLRVEPVRAHLAARLARRLAPAHCLQLRALPDLGPDVTAQVDRYIAAHFDEVCESGAMAALPLIRIEMLRESSAEDGEEAADAVAGAALRWLRDLAPPAPDLAELSARAHLLYVDAGGALRDCGLLPPARTDAPALREYRREAQEREARRPTAPPPVPAAPAGAPVWLGERGAARDEWRVVAARRAAGGAGGARVTRALLALPGRLVAARVAWRPPAGSEVARGAPLGSGERRASMAQPRCALGCAELGGRLVVCGGYDRARALRAAEAYDPAADAWAPLPDMREARARCAAARLGGALYALGGSDGHAELASVEALEAGATAWRARAKLPVAREHAAAAAHEARGRLYAVGGWAGGRSLRQVHVYAPERDEWTEAPPLLAGRAQCAAAVWEGALWALGGCDAWHCLASTERLALEGDARGEAGGWEAGPPLPSARRGAGAAVWRGRLVVAGGSDGAASLRRTDWLLPGAAGAAGVEWGAGPALRTARAGLGLGVVGGALLAAGGYSGKQFLSCVECLLQPDGEWTELRDAPPPRAALTPPPPAPAAPAAPAAPTAPSDVTEHEEEQLKNGARAE